MPWLELALDVALFGALMGGGAAIWFGWFRRWADLQSVRRTGFLGVPWLAIGILAAFLLTRVPQALGLPPPTLVRDAILLTCTGLVFSVMLFQRPRWATPRWFREQEARRERSSTAPPDGND